MHICHHWVIWCYLLMRCRNWWPLHINQPVCDRTSDPIISPWSIVKSTLVIGEFVEILGVDGWMKSVLTFLLSVWIQIDTVVPRGTVQIPIFDDPRPSLIDSLAISPARHWPSGRDRAGARGRKQLLQQRRLAAQFALGTLGLLRKAGDYYRGGEHRYGKCASQRSFPGFSTSMVWICFFPVCLFFLFHVLSISFAICSILELEAAISTVFCNIIEFEPLIYSHFHCICNIVMLYAAFWSSKLPFERYLQLRTSHFRWYLQHVGARTVHVTW